MAVRINLTVDDDIPELLTQLAGSERKRGEYLSIKLRELFDGERIRKEDASMQNEFVMDSIRSANLRIESLEIEIAKLHKKIKEVERKIA